MACFPDFLSQKVGNARICAAVALLASVGSDLLANPDELFGRPDCKISKDQRKIKVGRIDLLIDGVSTGVYLKRYNAFSARYRIGSLVLSSGAVKSVRGAEILSRAGISTATPLASIERRSWGILNSSFFLSKEIIRGKTADAYWRENLTPIRGAEGFRHRRRFLKALASLFVGLHEHGIYHNDLKDVNILVHDGSSGEHFALLDLEGVRHCWYLSRRRRVKAWFS